MYPKQIRNESVAQQRVEGNMINEKRRLLAEIQAQRETLHQTEIKLAQHQKQFNHMSESNQRNIKRLVKYRGKLNELYKHKNEPEYFLYICGFMNEYMQEFMLSHDFHVMNMQEEGNPNPDNMSYEQLLELGESIGKVSKGISREEFESLPRKKNLKSDSHCPICCTQFSWGDLAVVLRCKHAYHEQCIMEWLKDENTCPICKKHVLE